MPGPLAVIVHRAWSGFPLKTVAAVTATVVLVALGVQSDVPLPEPASVTCDSVGYSYDAAGQLVGVQDRANETARYAYDEVGNQVSVVNDGVTDLAVLSVVPGAASPGSQVTIQGGCFADDPADNLVSFNGSAAEVTEADARRLVATVPPGATSGPVAVQVGDAVATGPQEFVVDESSLAPELTAVSPTLAAPGDTISVTGTGFQDDPAANNVTLNRTRAFVSGISAGGMDLEVPTGATSGRVGVRTVHGNAASGEDIFVPPPQYGVDEVDHAARTALDTPHTVTVDTPGHIGLVVFDLVAGQSAAVTLASGSFGSCGISTARVFDPYGNPVASDGCAGTDGFIDRFTASVEGTYTLLLPASDSASGTISAEVHDVPDDAAAEIAPGGDPVTLTTTVPGQEAAASFEGVAGQRIAVSLRDGDLSSGQASAALRDAAGTTVASSNLCGGGCFLDTTTLPADGRYTVWWEPSGARTGAVTVQAYDVPPDAAATTSPGEPAQTVTTSVPGQNAVVSFEGSAGQVVTVTGFAGSLSLTRAAGRLVGPDGGVLESSSLCGEGCGFDYVELPADGTYGFVWDPDGAFTGELTVQVHDAADDVTATVAPDGDPVTVTTSVPGQNAVVSFEGSAGQVVTVAGFAGSLSLTQAAARLRGPDGGVLESSSLCGDGCEFDYLTLPDDGTYTFQWDPDGGRTGQLSVAVHDHDTGGDVVVPVEPGGDPVRVTTAVAGQNAVVEFEGTAGQLVSVTAFDGTYGSATASATLRDPAGEVLGSAASCGTSCAFHEVTLPDDGTYRLLIDPEGDRTGGITVQVHDDVTGDDVVVDTEPGAAPVTVTTSLPGQAARVRFPGSAGQVVTVTAFDGSLSFTRASAVLVGPDGQTLASENFCGDDCGFDYVELPDDGTYTLRWEPTGDNFGQISVNVHDAADDATVTVEPGGEPAALTTTIPGQNAVVSFEGSAGQVVTVTGFDGSLSFTRASAVLLGPDGETLASENFCGDGCGFDYVELPDDGTYGFRWDPTESNVGDIVVQVHDAADDVRATVEPGGDPAVLTTTIPGQNALAEFTGNAGQVVTVTGFDGSLSFTRASAALLGPDGETLDSVSFCGDDCGFDYVELPGDGTYAFRWDPTESYTGEIVVGLHNAANDASAQTELGGEPATVTTTIPGQNAVVSFEGSAGQVVTVAASDGSLSFTQASASLRGPDGETLDSTSFCGDDCTLEDVTLPGDGGYAFHWDPAAGHTGQITVQVGQSTAAGTGGGAGAVTPPADEPPPDERGSGEFRPGEFGWVPDRLNLAGQDWRSHRTPEPADLRPALLADPGVTAVSGHVLVPDGDPLSGVTVSAGGQTTRTDSAGRFLLVDLPAGHHVLVVDGGGAGAGTAAGDREYGRFEVGVDLTAGETHELPYPIWMSALDTTHAVSIPSPTTEETVVTTPLMPGFEVRLPEGTVIEDRDGEPVTELSITPIPTDQPPFPLPGGVVTPVYFTVQPGGAVVLPEGAQIVYPNSTGLAAGSRVEFWDYDAERVPCTNPPVKSYPKPERSGPAAAPEGCDLTGAEAGWYVYGHGTVSADGSQVVPDPEVRVWELTGTMINSGLQAAPFGPGEDGAAGGDPVDLGTGLFVAEHTDLVVDDVMPLALTRTYRQLDDAVRPFGVGTNFNYGVFLQSEQQYQEADLVFPDSGKVHFERTSPGTGFTDAVFAAVGTTGPYRDAVLAWNGAGWDLTRTDGMTYVFGDEQPLQAIRDRHGNQITITRSGGPSIIPGQGGNIVQITSPNGRWIKLDYEPDTDRVVAATDNGGRTVQYGYDDQGRLTEVTSPGGRTTSYTYDAEDRMTSVTDPRGITYLTNTYDSEGRVATQQLPGGASYEFDYTTDGEGTITRTAVTDPEGIVDEVSFDEDGRVVSETYAAGTPLARTATVERDPATRLPTVLTDPYGRATELDYGPGGHLDGITTQAGTAAAQRLTVESGGPFAQVESVTDEHGRSRTLAYDELGNLTSITDGEGRVQTYEYNDAGQMTAVTDPAGNTTTYTYQYGDLVAVTDPLGRTTRQFVDALGRVSSVTDPLGVTERVSYDPDGNVATTTGALGHQTSFEYDGNGNVVEVTDPKGGTTTVEYDDSDRPVTVTDPLGNQTQQSYDLLGRATSVTDRNGDTTVVRYDELGRTTFIGYGETAGPSYESSRTYTYDDLDRLTSIEDTAAEGGISVEYDELDQITSVTGPAGTIGYEYDDAGRRAGMTVPGQPEVSYTYDDTGLIESITQGGTVATWQRDAAGRTVGIERAGVVTGYEYDQASQLVGIGYRTSDGDPIGDLRYDYGADGRVVALSGSLAQVTVPETGPARGYDQGNRLVSLGGEQLTYDGEGNLTGDGTLAYTWNARGELTAVDGPEVAVSFGYDAAGRRASVTSDGATTSFHYDGPNLVQEQVDGAGGVARLTGDLDQTLLRTDGDGAQVPVTDRLGTVLGLVDSDGTLTTQYGYDPFGAGTSSGAGGGSGVGGDGQRFTGREYDPDTGLQYHRARYYSPELGRFISEDPAGFAGGSSNLYLYALNDPANLSDPNGDCPICVAVVIGGLVGGSTGVAFGWGEAALTGRKYTFRDGLRDFAIWGTVGAVSGGASAWLRGGSGVWRAGQLGRTGADGARGGGWVLPEAGGGARLGGRWYTEHALERMAPRTPQVMAELERRALARAQRQGIQPGTREFGRWWAKHGPDPRGVPPSVVEAEIANPGSTGVRVITNSSGDVVTVIPVG